MLSYLDCLIFPDRCEVYEVVPSQRYVYPIYKNGSSSLLLQAYTSKWKVKLNEQNRLLSSIDVILRDPSERLVSGINTFVQHTIRDNSTLDRETILWFAKNYLYLNRHYSLQFSWIVNLARYIGINTTLNLLPMAALSEFTDFNQLPPGIESASAALIENLKEIPNHEMYQRLDNALLQSCLNKSITFKELLSKVRCADPDAYEFVVDRSQKILNPLYVLSET